MTERNPYLILGVDYGASPADARRHFAMAARRARRGGGRWAKEDLTWALHEVESAEGDPADSVSTFRVPADATAFDPSGEGLFRPPPVPLARRSAPSTADERDALAVAASGELVWAALTAGAPHVLTSHLAYPVPQEPT
jgi:hypothetical protein